MYFHHRDERTRGPLDEDVLRHEWFWSLWSTRLQPYNELTDGDTVGLVVTDAVGSTIRFVVTIRDVLKTPFATKSDSSKKLASHTGLSAADVTADAYTAAKSERPGFLICWRADQIQRVNLPRPADLMIRQHGWGREDDPARLNAWGVGKPLRIPKKPPLARGQGWQTSIEANRAVEHRSMDVAHEWLVACGYHDINDVSKQKSWDYEGRLAGSKRVRHVEVKGLTGTGLECVVTRNEVAAAGKAPGDTVLLVVNGIQLQPAADGSVQASGGTLHAFDPWSPAETELEPERYRWRPAPGRIAKPSLS